MIRSASLVLVALGLGACAQPDWRARAVDDAERAVRVETGDPNAAFSAVQVTGDQSTGQVCGNVTARDDTILSGAPAKFIFYIDGGGGNDPWVEGNPGPHKAPDFLFNWHADCVREGYSQSA